MTSETSSMKPSAIDWHKQAKSASSCDSNRHKNTATHSTPSWNRAPNMLQGGGVTDILQPLASSAHPAVGRVNISLALWPKRGEGIIATLAGFVQGPHGTYIAPMKAQQPQIPLNAEPSVDRTLRFAEDGTFQVTVFSDLHYGESKSPWTLAEKSLINSTLTAI